MGSELLISKSHLSALRLKLTTRKDPALTITLTSSVTDSLLRPSASRESKKIEKTLGPGDYSPEKATSHVKQTSPSVNFTKKEGRKFAKIETSGGPGSYRTTNEFASNLGKKTIGTKRVTKTERTVGPSDYKPVLESVKPSTRAINFIR